MSRRLLLLSLLPLLATAQIPTEPPGFIRLVRTAARPSHRSSVAGYYRLAAADLHVFGLVTLSGASEAWFLETHDTYSSIEALDTRLGPVLEARTSDAADELIGSLRPLIAIYQPAWSYRPDQAVRNLSKARYFQIIQYRIQPGSESTFATLANNRRRAFDAINLDRPELCYRVTSGTESGTILFVSPLLSLAQLDSGHAKSPAYADAVSESSSDNREALSRIVYSRENTLLRLRPALSYVSDEFAESDPEFWRPAKRQ